jgi:pyruvate kinase
MVARGDLGVECPPEDVPLYQKRIIAAANARGVPVITATQMLESMVDELRPTRAEASDVANAILDGSDAVMLSAETAMGKHPVEAVRMMDAIARRIEASEMGRSAEAQHRDDDVLAGDATEAVARAARHAAEHVGAAAILVHTVSGAAALRVARQRPHVPVVALSPRLDTVRRLQLVRGVVPRLLRPQPSTDRMLLEGLRAVRRMGLLRRGQVVVVMAGATPHEGASNMVKIDRVR